MGKCLKRPMTASIWGPFEAISHRLSSWQARLDKDHKLDHCALEVHFAMGQLTFVGPLGTQSKTKQARCLKHQSILWCFCYYPLHTSGSWCQKGYLGTQRSSMLPHWKTVSCVHHNRLRGLPKAPNTVDQDPKQIWPKYKFASKENTDNTACPTPSAYTLARLIVEYGVLLEPLWLLVDPPEILKSLSYYIFFKTILHQGTVV